MATEHYEYDLSASAGGTRVTLEIRENGEVEIEYHWRAMGNLGHHYHLYGKHQHISDAHGWLHINQVEDMWNTPAVTVPIEALGGELIYEYVKLPRSRFLQHPEDMLWMAGRWNEYFDLILFVSGFDIECFYGLKYLIAENLLEEIEPPEMLVHINDTFMEHLTHLLDGLDRMKFTKMDGDERSNGEG